MAQELLRAAVDGSLGKEEAAAANLIMQGSLLPAVALNQRQQEKVRGGKRSVLVEEAVFRRISEIPVAENDLLEENTPVYEGTYTSQ